MANWKRLVPLMIIPCVLFAGCVGSRRDADVDRTGITEYYKALGGMKMQVSIAADFPERISKYRVRYTYNRDAESCIELIEPKDVSGIKIRISEDLSRLEYDGARLETGKLSQSGITPMSALPLMMREWSLGNASQFEEGKHDGADAMLMVYSSEINGEAVEYRTWFDRQSYYPLYAEVFADGRCMVRCEFETVDVNQQK